MKNFQGALTVDEFLARFGHSLTSAQVATLKRLRDEGNLQQYNTLHSSARLRYERIRADNGEYYMCIWHGARQHESFTPHSETFERIVGIILLAIPLLVAYTLRQEYMNMMINERLLSIDKGISILNSVAVWLMMYHPDDSDAIELLSRLEEELHEDSQFNY